MAKDPLEQTLRRRLKITSRFRPLKVPPKQNRRSSARRVTGLGRLVRCLGRLVSESAKSEEANEEEEIALTPQPDTPPPAPADIFASSQPSPHQEHNVQLETNTAGNTQPPTDSAPQDARNETPVETTKPNADSRHVPDETAQVDVSRLSVSEAPSGSSRFQEEFQRSQVMAAAGPPATLVQRYERQQVDNRLSLDPIVYNVLVFGELPPSA